MLGLHDAATRSNTSTASTRAGPTIRARLLARAFLMPVLLALRRGVTTVWLPWVPNVIDTGADSASARSCTRAECRSSGARRGAESAPRKRGSGYGRTAASRMACRTHIAEYPSAPATRFDTCGCGNAGAQCLAAMNGCGAEAVVVFDAC